ncbi:hypothetical protein HXX76_011286 [Chlamydomonas incerta]|uniref:Uncharacterized protein n=1 Tax=Chlamydomonas incerta TaxID=51695 RepID=A0A835VXD1_CHLIN|nr:hypothetical protein HXX76_011286 [Chlamydomonas incerta]|eukprot:KAG2429044.1 hypothetical protein HXX76_011286 [Chlamydomonas incerta]
MQLWDRATHVYFLRALANHKTPGSTKGGVLGDIATWMVVKEFVRPATAHTKSDFVQCLMTEQLPPNYALPWCGPGGKMAVAAAASAGGDSGDAAPQAMFGPTTYFASHAWGYKFSELVDLLEAHYAALPDSQGGAVYVPVFYWVDILAVTQHFSGDFKDHPDSNFPGVIRASRAVLFTMHPWRSPVAPTRVWCLFEALMAVESKGVGLEVLLDTRDSADTRPQTLLAIVSSINVLTAQATVASDKSYIMDCISRGLGAAAFNATLKRLLRDALLDTMMRKAIRGARTADDAVSYGPLVELLKTNSRNLPNAVVDVPRLMPYASAADIISLAASYSAANCPRVLVLSGRDGCTEARHRRHVGSTDEDWAVDYYTASLKVWSYLPLTNKAAAAVGRMLTKIASGSGSAGAGAGGGGGGGGLGAASGSAAAGGATRPAQQQTLISTSSSGVAAAAATSSASPLRAGRGSIPMASAAGAGGASTPAAHASPSAAAAATSTGGAIAGRRAGVGMAGGSSNSATVTASTSANATGVRAAPIAGRRATGNSGAASATASSSNTAGSTVHPLATAAALGSSGGGGGGSSSSLTALNTGGAGGGEDGGGGDGTGSGGGLQELWLRLGNAVPPTRWRQPLTDRDHGVFTAEEVAKAAKPESFRAWKREQDPKWQSVHEIEGLPKHLITQMQLDWQEKEEFEKWKDGVLTDLLITRTMQEHFSKDKRRRYDEQVQPERAERGELWRGLAAYGALRVLCLHRSVLCLDDVKQLAGVLRASRGLKELLLLECEAEEEGFSTGLVTGGQSLPGRYTRGRGFGAAGHTAPLTSRLLAAALGGSGSLTRLTLTPPRLAVVEEWEPGLAAAAAGGAQALEELVLAPVALSPTAAKQLAEVLAALPALRGGAVDCLKAPPLTAPPAAAADEMTALQTQPYKPPEGYPKTVPQEALRKLDWKLHYPRGTTHEVMRSTRTPDLSYYPQYCAPAPAAELAALPHVLHLASARGGATQPAQRVAVLTHWLLAVAAGPSPAAAAVASAKAAVARKSPLQPDPTDLKPGEPPTVADSLLETDFEVGPKGVEALLAGLQAAGRELEAASLKATTAATSCSYSACWPHLVPPSRRRAVLGPDADQLLSGAPRPPPLPASSAAAQAAAAGGSGGAATALDMLLGGMGGVGAGSGPIAASAPVVGGGGAHTAKAVVDDSDEDFSDLDNVGWRPQPGLKWQQ